MENLCILAKCLGKEYNSIWTGVISTKLEEKKKISGWDMDKDFHWHLILLLFSFYCYYYCHNCVNNKILEHDWLLAALIYGLIGSFGPKLSDLTHPITNICNRT